MVEAFFVTFYLFIRIKGKYLFMEEIWRTIKDFEMYMVSNWGRVKSLKCGKEKILKPIKLKNGYFIVNLYKKSKSKTFHIHILVFDAFSEEKRNGRILQVDHRNNDKTDNRIENLQLLNLSLIHI